jgi:hypothetical protein
MEKRGKAFADLEGMPGFLGAAAARIGSHFDRPPQGGGFSFLEQVWHLADLEVEGYGERIARLRAGGRPDLADFDGDRIARERNYRSLSLEKGFARFRGARARNLETLRGLTEAEWDASGTQEKVGPVTLRDLPRMMRDHDAGHRREIESLLSELDA